MSDALKLIDFSSYQIKTALPVLLQDKSTKKNIIWATDPPESSLKITDKSQITEKDLNILSEDAILPRTSKNAENQFERTRKKGEVFTPAWICNLMNNLCDEDWFGRKDVFNFQTDKSWCVNPEPINFPEGKNWKSYVDSRRLEITCGEAPYLVSRYDVSTGEPIIISDRIGILDRKIRVVNENASDFSEWFNWIIRAFQSVYGYEYQGDNLLIARVNLLMTFTEYYEEHWNKVPVSDEILKIANVISWNLWQMDGLNNTVPFGKPYEKYRQTNLFDSFGSLDSAEPESVSCKIFDWRSGSSLRFAELKNEV